MIENNDEMHTFFNYIEKGNTDIIISFFKDKNKKPWEFLTEENNTGKNKFNLGLHRACYFGHNELVSKMIEQMKKRLGINAPIIVKKWINARTVTGFTALHFASHKGIYDLLSILINEGAEVEAINDEGLNVLHMASQGNQPLSLVLFKEQHCMNPMSVDDSGSTPLHWAAYTGSKDALIYLLSWNVDVNAQDKEGLTPLHLAVISGNSFYKLANTHLVRKLLQKGASKIIKDNKNRDASTLAKEKDKLEIYNLLNEQIKCRMLTMNVQSTTKHEKNRSIYVFLIFYLTSNIFMYLVNLIRKNFIEIRKFSLYFKYMLHIINHYCCD